MSPGPENRFRKRVGELLLREYGPDVYTQKHHGSTVSAGLPDVLVLVRGWYVWAELKAARGTVFHWGEFTALQDYTMGLIVKAGGRAGVLVYYPTADAVVWVPWGEASRLREDEAARGILDYSPGRVNIQQPFKGMTGQCIRDLLDLPGPQGAL